MDIRKKLHRMTEGDWEQLAEEVRTRLQRGALSDGGCVQAQAGDVIITLDAVPRLMKDVMDYLGHPGTTFDSRVRVPSLNARARAPFLNRSGFRFVIYRSGFLSELQKHVFGMEDVKVGQPDFDASFIIQGTDPERTRRLFADFEIRVRLQALPRFHLAIAGAEDRWFGPAYPPDVDVLTLLAPGLTTDPAGLRNLFRLFSEILERLQTLEAAGTDENARLLEALAGPGGQAKSGETILWDGNPARRRAAEKLGWRRVAAAVEPLAQALTDADPVLRAKAARALGRIGDRSVVPRLMLLLGDFEPADEKPVRAAAVEALRKLGAQAAVRAFERVLGGDRSDIEPLRDPWLAASDGLVRVLQTADPRTVARAAAGLMELGAAETLPEVRRAARKLHGAAPEIREELDRAITELDRRADLPRPSAAPAPDASALPRPAGAPCPDKGQLPIPASRGTEK